MRITVNMFGHARHFDMTPEDIARTYAEGQMGCIGNEIDDGLRDQWPSFEEFASEVAHELFTWKRIELSIDGLTFDMPTPEEVRFIGHEGIRRICREIGYPED